jgi:adenine-specific DNA-methyltransferase
MSLQIPLDLPAGFDVSGLGQVFTPPAVVDAMRLLVRNRGRVLEPSCGDGAFLRHFPAAVGVELDPQHAPPGARVMDFFDFPGRTGDRPRF